VGSTGAADARRAHKYLGIASKMKKSKCLFCDKPPKGVNIQYFDVPENSMLRRKWLRNMGLPRSWQPDHSRFLTLRTMVCARHFTHDQFEPSERCYKSGTKFVAKRRRKLTPDAVPTLFNKEDLAPFQAVADKLTTEHFGPLATRDHDYDKEAFHPDEKEYGIASLAPKHPFRDDYGLEIIDAITLKKENYELRRTIQLLEEDNEERMRMLQKILNEDQITFLSGKASKIIWTHDTIDKATELLKKCGVKGYTHLRFEEKYPLPSLELLEKQRKFRHSSRPVRQKKEASAPAPIEETNVVPLECLVQQCTCPVSHYVWQPCILSKSNKRKRKKIG
jgi:hypothetical protein